MRLGGSFNSGAFRFALVVAALFAIGSLALLLVVDRSVRAYADEATAIGLRSETSVLTREFPEGGRSELVDTIRRRGPTGGERPFRYLLVDRRGVRLAGDLPSAAARSGWSAVRFVDDGEPGGDAEPETLTTLGTVLDDGLLLVVATDTYDIQKLRWRLDMVTLASGLAITLLALAGGYVIGGLFLRRLERVNEAAGRIMAGRLSERLPPIGMAPEFDGLSRNLNLMLDRIGELMEGLRQVSTDIAHDLRTPLTRLRQQLEDLQDAPSLAVSRAAAEAALAQADEILAVFRALLRIGALEGGAPDGQLPAVDLSEVADRLVQAYRPEFEDAGHRLEARIAPLAEVRGDGELLAQAFANLLDNALSHTPRGTTVTMVVEREAGGVMATISDNGPGVPEVERPRILRRFYRLDSSRGAPGSGLGLSLVAAIAKMHGAALSLGSASPGLVVRLAFPQSLDGGGSRPALRPAPLATSA